MYNTSYFILATPMHPHFYLDGSDCHWDFEVYYEDHYITLTVTYWEVITITEVITLIGHTVTTIVKSTGLPTGHPIVGAILCKCSVGCKENIKCK